MKFIYDTEAEIPASLKDHYKANAEGKWELQVEGAVAKTKVDEFRAKNIALQQELDTTKAKYKDIDPEKWPEYKQAAEDAATGKSIKKDGFDEAVEKRVVALRTDMEAKLKAEQDARTKAEADLSTLRLDHALRDAGGKRGIRKEAVNDLLLRGRQNLRFEDGKLIAYDDAGQKRFGASGDPMTAEEWADDLLKNAPHLFEPNRGSGSGGSGNGQAYSGPNPFKKGDSWNVTAQMQLMKKDAALATKLKAAAEA
jgi:hypothetical protein